MKKGDQRNGEDGVGMNQKIRNQEKGRKDKKKEEQKNRL